MIKIKCDLSNDKQVKKAFEKAAKEFPKEMERAYMRAGSIITRKITKAVRETGSKDTGKFDPLSEIRNALNPGRESGGVLTILAKGDKNIGHKGICRVQKHGHDFYCGYITRVQPVFSRWQDGGNVGLDNTNARAVLHRRLGAVGRRDIIIPTGGTQPRRDVIGPITALASKNLSGWIIGALNNMLKKRLGRDAITTTAKPNAGNER